MAQINYHPAPGLGDLLPGFHTVPQNPFKGEPITYQPRIGEILPASYSVPQNPIKDYMGGRLHQIAREPGAEGVLNGKVVGVGCGDVGCGGIGNCGCASCGGLGDISSDLSAVSDKFSAGDYMGAIQAPIFGIPLWAIVAAIVAVPMLMGKSGGRR